MWQAPQKRLWGWYVDAMFSREGSWVSSNQTNGGKRQKDESCKRLFIRWLPGRSWGLSWGEGTGRLWWSQAGQWPYKTPPPPPNHSWESIFVQAILDQYELTVFKTAHIQDLCDSIEKQSNQAINKYFHSSTFVWFKCIFEQLWFLAACVGYWTWVIISGD